jgi:hypothetical protein
MSTELSNDALTGNDDADAFLNLWKSDANQPSDNDEDKKKKPVAPTQDETDEDTSEETPEDDEEVEDQDEADEEDDEDESDDDGEDQDKGTKKTLAGDDAEVEVSVDGKTLKVAVKDLKRLYGQEAALTRKSQEVAEIRKKADEAGSYHVAGLTKLLERAREAYKPYAEIDFLLAAKTLEPDEYTALRDDALKRHADVQFLEQELGTTLETARTERTKQLQAEAKETLKILTDPEKGIKGFDQKMYDDMRSFAISSGIPAEVVNNTVSAPLLRILHKAMLYDKGQKAPTVKKDVKAKKIVKSSQNSQSTRQNIDPAKKAMKKLQSTGAMEDAADAFMAKWK